MKVRFDLRRQITALKETLLTYQALGLESMAFLSGAIVLWVAALHERVRLTALRRLLWQMAWPLAACLMYALVHVESRFVGAFLVLLWLAVYGALMLRLNRRVAAAISATVLCTVMLPFTAHLAKESVRTIRDLICARLPDYQIAALGLTDLGLQKGDRLAIVGNAYDCYYARYDGLHVVAQIPNASEFWHLSAPELQLLSERLGGIGVRAVVASNKPEAYALADSPKGTWREIKVSDSVQLSVLLLSPEVVRKVVTDPRP
jgi:hypothetical protein